MAYWLHALFVTNNKNDWVSIQMRMQVDIYPHSAHYFYMLLTVSKNDSPPTSSHAQQAHKMHSACHDTNLSHIT